MQTEDRAHAYQSLAKYESKRGVRKLIAGGLLVTQSPGFLKSKDGQIPPRPRIEQFAKDAGLEKLYTVLYSVGSEAAHGFDFGIKRRRAEEMSAIVELSAGVLVTATHITARWVFAGRVTAPEELDHLLSPGTIKA